MFLSKVNLACDDLSPADVHHKIGSAFPDDLPKSERVLWRWRDTDSILVQSMYPPVWRAASVVVDAELKEFDLEDHLAAVGNQYSFRLLANTCRGAGREGIYSIPQQRTWLVDRANDMGVEFLSFQVSTSAKWQFWNGGHCITLAVACFDGSLVVTDVDRARSAVRRGIGHAKAFGCGLISLA